ncbi:MAG: hypothetical protein ACOZQL_36220 [Myxococcota bacterium]
MNLTPAQWMEVGFNLTYLVIISALVALMTVRLASVDDPTGVLHRIRNGFFFLALGDTGHVGFRVVALFRGGLESTVSLFGVRVHLVGVGALATAITVTILYLLLLDVWRVRFASRTPLYWALVAIGVLRLALLLPPQNDWGAVVPPLAWSLIRNAPLLVLGVAVAVLFLREGRRANDRTFVQFGALIVLSYAFYLPVILFVHAVPAIGVLMVPKTIVYLVMAWLAYVRLFAPHGDPLTTRPRSA